MPNGQVVIVPLILGIVATTVSFKILSGCDMVKTEWNINCSTETTSNCLFVSELSIGLLAKEILVGTENENNEIQYSKVCQWHTEEDGTWLLDPLWIVAKWCLIGSLISAVINIGVLVMSSCYEFGRKNFKRVSILFGIISFLNLIPMMLYFASDVCKDDVFVCDETETNCVVGCKMGPGSWQLLASSFTFLSTMISIWTILSHQSQDHLCDHGNNIKRVNSITDSDSSNDSDCC